MMNAPLSSHMNIAIPTTVNFLFQIAILVASNVSVHWGPQLRWQGAEDVRAERKQEGCGGEGHVSRDLED